MPKYEIMLIVDPKADIKKAEDMARDVFKDDLKKFEKMEQTQLAYPINKSNTAQYALLDLKTDGENIKEFTRRVNIDKSIWRQLTINLDSEKQMDKERDKKKSLADIDKEMREKRAQFRTRGPRKPYNKEGSKPYNKDASTRPAATKGKDE